MSFKSKVIDWIDDEVRKASNYQNINTKQAQQANPGAGVAKCTEIDQKTGTLTVTVGNKTFLNIQPVGGPVGPGTCGILLGGSILQVF